MSSSSINFEDLNVPYVSEIELNNSGEEVNQHHNQTAPAAGTITLFELLPQLWTEALTLDQIKQLDVIFEIETLEDPGCLTEMEEELLRRLITVIYKYIEQESSFFGQNVQFSNPFVNGVFPEIPELYSMTCDANQAKNIINFWKMCYKPPFLPTKPAVAVAPPNSETMTTTVAAESKMAVASDESMSRFLDNVIQNYTEIDCYMTYQEGENLTGATWIDNTGSTVWKIEKYSTDSVARIPRSQWWEHAKMKFLFTTSSSTLQKAIENAAKFSLSGGYRKKKLPLKVSSKVTFCKNHR